MLLLLIVGDPLVDLIGDTDHVMLLAKMGDVFQLFQGEDLNEKNKDRAKRLPEIYLAQRIIRTIDDDQPRSRIEHRFQFFLIECPVSTG